MGEVVSIAESDVIRAIDRINGVDTDAIYDEVGVLRRKLKMLKRDGIKTTSREIRSIYDRLDELQFVPEYLLLVIDKNSDYIRASKGIILNGVTYKRLLGTPGGIKCSTIVFMAEGRCKELEKNS